MKLIFWSLFLLGAFSGTVTDAWRLAFPKKVLEEKLIAPGTGIPVIFGRALIGHPPPLSEFRDNDNAEDHPVDHLIPEDEEKFDFYRDREPQCPPLPPPSKMGKENCTDIHQCEAHGDCPELGEKCCASACGKECLTTIHMNTVPPVPATIPFMCPGQSSHPGTGCEDSCKMDADCKLNEKCCANQCGKLACVGQSY